MFERFRSPRFRSRDVWPDQALAPVLESYVNDAASTGVYLKSHADTLIDNLILTYIGKEKDAPHATLWKIREINHDAE